MNTILTMSYAKRLCYLMCGLFFIIHVCLLIVFLVCGVYPLAYFNIFSILFYCASMFVIQRKLFRFFVISSFFEICVHMGLAIILCGWNVGFQVTIIGVCILIFYAEYAGKSLGIKTVSGLALTPIAAATYISALIISWGKPPMYPLPGDIAFGMQLSWAVILFSIASVILHTFVSVATKSQETLANEMLHDKLTGLPNRYYITRVFKRFSEAAEIGGYWLAIADLDDFKHINDTYGHNCGDYVLKTAASLIREAAGDCEICRWGGEEFLIVSSGLVDREETLKRVCAAVGSYRFRYDEISFRMTLTVGSAVRKDGQSIADWIDRADKKLYIGKSSGKNQYVL
ncbi:MAG: GGDEF domain-containing protein [Oscillospiraceae bacterium]|nr:GGDEF domain-containing protein [Oscillospiraceae bacterium]